MVEGMLFFRLCLLDEADALLDAIDVVWAAML